MLMSMQDRKKRPKLPPPLSLLSLTTKAAGKNQNGLIRMNTESSSKMKENEEMRTLPELLVLTGCVGQGGAKLGDELGVGLGGELDDKLGEG